MIWFHFVQIHVHLSICMQFPYLISLYFVTISVTITLFDTPTGLISNHQINFRVHKWKLHLNNKIWIATILFMGYKERDRHIVSGINFLFCSRLKKKYIYIFWFAIDKKFRAAFLFYFSYKYHTIAYMVIPTQLKFEGKIYR